MADWLYDFRFAARTLRCHASVTLLAVLALALGIGAATAIFSVVDGVLLRPLPYPHPDQLTLVYQVFASGGRGTFSEANFEDLRQQSRSFAGLAQYATSRESVSGGAEAVRALMAVARVTSSRSSVCLPGSAGRSRPTSGARAHPRWWWSATASGSAPWAGLWTSAA